MIHISDSADLSSVLYVFGILGFLLFWSFAKSSWAKTSYLSMVAIIGFSPAYTEWVGENLWSKETDGTYRKIPSGVYWQWEFNRTIKDRPVFRKQTSDIYVVWICRGPETVKVLVQVKDFDSEVKLRKFLELSPEEKDIGLKWKIENLTAQIFGRHEPLFFAPAVGASRDNGSLSSSLHKVGLTLVEIRSVPKRTHSGGRRV